MAKLSPDTQRRMKLWSVSRPPTHPAEVLINEFLRPGQSHIPGVGAQTLLDLIYGDGRVTPRLARSLSLEFGTTAQFWLNLQRAWDAYPWTDGVMFGVLKGETELRDDFDDPLTLGE